MKFKTTEIFYLADEFCKEFYKAGEGHALTQTTVRKARNIHFVRENAPAFRDTLNFPLYSCYPWLSGVLRLLELTTNLLPFNLKF